MEMRPPPGTSKRRWRSAPGACPPSSDSCEHRLRGGVVAESREEFRAFRLALRVGAARRRHRAVDVGEAPP